MRKLIMAGVAGIALGSLAAPTVLPLAWSQSAPPSADLAAPPSDDGAPAPAPPHGPPAPPWTRWMEGRGPEGMRGHMHEPPSGGFAAPGTFALFFRPADRQLTPADVQKIAEAMLLWNGNRDWKVTQVQPAADGKIGFAFATPEGSVVARFTMDAHTGRMARVG